jgi:hypothetical protein
MKNFILLLWVLCALPITLFSQTINFDKYKPLEATGKLPEVLEVKSMQKYRDDKSNTSLEGNRRDRKAQDQFLLESNFIIDDLLQSGKVLYNDPVSVYVKKVMDEVARQDEKLANVQIFVIRSSVVNAFATNQGIIFITTGLLAQLDSEAQLAFILCHEGVHYRNKHVLKGYVESKKIERGAGDYRGTDVDEKYLAKNNHSREHETEADVEGLELYKQTKYSLEAVDGVFDVLKYAALPFDEVEFNLNILQTEHLQFPKSAVLEKVKEIEGEDEDEDDKKSTHPNLGTRRKNMQEGIEGVSNAGRREFLMPEADFYQMRKLARFELCRTNLLDRDYEPALYHAYSLLQHDPQSRYLKVIVLRSLYGLAKYKNSSRYKEVHTKPDKIEGSSQRVNHLFSKLESNELNVVALNYAWRLKKQHPGDKEIQALTTDLFKELVVKHYHERKNFMSTPREKDTTAAKDSLTIKENEKKDDDAAEEKVDDEKAAAAAAAKAKADKERSKSKGKDKEKESKYSKIKRKTGDQDKSYWVNYAFVDLMADPEFTEAFDNYIRQYKKAKNKKAPVKKRKKKYITEDEEEFDKNNIVLEDEATTKEKKAKAKERKKITYEERKGYSLGLEKVIFMNPFYIKVDERKKTAVQYGVSEERQELLNQRIRKCADAARLSYEMLDKKKLGSSEAETYNNISLMTDWLDERLDHKKINFLCTDHERIQEYSDRTGTHHLALVGAVNYIERRPYKASVIVICLSLPYAIPWGLYYILTPKRTTYVYAMVYNLKTGVREMGEVKEIKMPDREDVMNATIYELVQGIRFEKYEKKK